MKLSGQILQMSKCLTHEKISAQKVRTPHSKFSSKDDSYDRLDKASVAILDVRTRSRAKRNRYIPIQQIVNLATTSILLRKCSCARSSSWGSTAAKKRSHKSFEKFPALR